jgi:hypothetical protein
MKAFILILSGILFSTSPAFAADRAITYYADPLHDPAKTAQIEWNIDSKRCEITYPKSKKADLKDCQKLNDLFDRDGKKYLELGADQWTAQKRSHRESSKAHYADLEIKDGKKTARFGILKTGAKICDAEGKNCSPSSTRASDQLGFAVREVFSKSK